VTAKDIITILIPVMVALITGLYAYLQTRKTSGVEGQKLNLTSYESLNKSQAEEINRLREDRAEDQKAARAEIEELRGRLAEVSRKCERQGARFEDLMQWTRQVSRILNDPGMIRILSASDVHIPAPPTWPDET
jgi:uncharacterized protein HemX